MNAKRTDNNQAEIVAALRKCGANVQSLAMVGCGCVDLLVGYAGDVYLLEVKGIRGRLTPEQIIWHAKWQGYVHIVRSAEDALRVIGEIGRESEQ